MERKTFNVKNLDPELRKGEMLVSVSKVKNMQKNESGEGEGVLVFTGTTNHIDRDGDVVHQDGVDYERYLNSNPVVLWSHDSRERPAIGKTLSITKIGRGHDFEIKFDLQDKFAKEIYRKAKLGFLSTVSIGFLVEDFDYDDSLDAFVLTSIEILEISVVNIPANPNAIINEESRKSLKSLAKGYQAKKENKSNEPLDIAETEEKHVEENTTMELKSIGAVVDAVQTLSDADKTTLIELLKIEIPAAEPTEESIATAAANAIAQAEKGTRDSLTEILNLEVEEGAESPSTTELIEQIKTQIEDLKGDSKVPEIGEDVPLTDETRALAEELSIELTEESKELDTLTAIKVEQDALIAEALISRKEVIELTEKEEKEKLDALKAEAKELELEHPEDVTSEDLGKLIQEKKDSDQSLVEAMEVSKLAEEEANATRLKEVLEAIQAEFDATFSPEKLELLASANDITAEEILAVAQGELTVELAEAELKVSAEIAQEKEEALKEVASETAQAKVDAEDEEKEEETKTDEDKKPDPVEEKE